MSRKIKIGIVILGYIRLLDQKNIKVKFDYMHVKCYLRMQRRIVIVEAVATHLTV